MSSTCLIISSLNVKPYRRQYWVLEFWDTGSNLDDGACLNPGNTALPRIYYGKFGRCRSNRVGGPKIWGTLGSAPLGRGGSDCKETRLSPTCVILPNSVALIINEIIQESLTFPVPPFNVTQGDWTRHGSIGHR